MRSLVVYTMLMLIQHISAMTDKRISSYYTNVRHNPSNAYACRHRRKLFCLYAMGFRKEKKNIFHQAINMSTNCPTSFVGTRAKTVDCRLQSIPVTLPIRKLKTQIFHPWTATTHSTPATYSPTHFLIYSYLLIFVYQADRRKQSLYISICSHICVYE